MPQVLKAPGVADIMDLKFYPFGNMYYASDACGKGPYDSNERHCWFNRCIKSESPPDDCFPADGMIAQHGERERQVNLVEACAVTLYPDWKVHWPFVQCMEQQYDMGAVQDCAKGTSLDGGRIVSCATGDAGAKAEEEMGKATPDHPGVPYILVDGQVLDDPKQMLHAICKAYTGEKPRGCHRAEDVSGLEVMTVVI